MISWGVIKFVVIVITMMLIASTNKFSNYLSKILKISNKVPFIGLLILGILAAITTKIKNPHFIHLNKLTNLKSQTDKSNQELDFNDILKTFNHIYTSETDLDSIKSKKNKSRRNNKNDNINISKKKFKRNVTESKKKTVAAKQKWRCGLCGRMLDETYEVDHIIPLYQGGSNEIDNLMALDPICHRKKTNADRFKFDPKYDDSYNSDSIE